jgi:nucleoside-diphosphate kinase
VGSGCKLVCYVIPVPWKEEAVNPYFERTLVLIKPDGVRRGLVGEILLRFERAGLVIVGLKMVKPTLEFARGHYATTDEQLRQMGQKTLSTYADLQIDPLDQVGTADALEIGRRVHEYNAEFLSSGPVVAIVLKGAHSVKKVRAIAGATMPRDAAPGTIRGDFSSTSPAISNTRKSAVFNLLHASDNELDSDEPEREVSYWFSASELQEYEGVEWKVMF